MLPVFSFLFHCPVAAAGDPPVPREGWPSAAETRGCIRSARLQGSREAARPAPEQQAKFPCSALRDLKGVRTKAGEAAPGPEVGSARAAGQGRERAVPQPRTSGGGERSPGQRDLPAGETEKEPEKRGGREARAQGNSPSSPASSDFAAVPAPDQDAAPVAAAAAPGAAPSGAGSEVLRAHGKASAPLCSPQVGLPHKTTLGARYLRPAGASVNSLGARRAHPETSKPWTWSDLFPSSVRLMRRLNEAPRS